jgi:hypothetical protein
MATADAALAATPAAIVPVFTKTRGVGASALATAAPTPTEMLTVMDASCPAARTALRAGAVVVVALQIRVASAPRTLRPVASPTRAARVRPLLKAFAGSCVQSKWLVPAGAASVLPADAAFLTGHQKAPTKRSHRSPVFRADPTGSRLGDDLRSRGSGPCQG